MPKALTKHFIGDSDVSFLDAPLISVPHTEITNRAKIRDLSKDFQARMGINRIMVQQAQRLQDEFGPAGQPVLSAQGDINDQIRMIGTSWSTGIPSTEGARPVGNVGDFLEITFYGTGLNLLCIDLSPRDYRVTVDGGAEGSNIITGSGSSPLTSRGYAENTPVNCATGLSLGLHTLKIRIVASNIHFYGIEILNENTQIHVAEGSIVKDQRKISHPASELVDYKPSGMGSKGGRVVLYSTGSGPIKSAYTNTNASQGSISDAANGTDHSNEEVIRNYPFREFGAGRTDDFGIPLGTSDVAFTLDDGTTTLVGEDVSSDATGVKEGTVIAQSANSKLIFTFIGTGLDVFNAASGAPSVAFPVVYINGTQLVSGGGAGPWTTSGWNKIVSGLPYGTHVVEISQASGGTGLRLSDFLVYGPKKPIIPDGAVEIADYYVMADFSANVTASPRNIATGTLRKHSTREFNYIGSGFAVASFFGANESIGGFQVSSATSGDAITYTFFGTGFEIRGRSNTVHTATMTLDIDGSTNHSSLTTSAYGGYGFTASTGVIDGNNSNTNGSGVSVSGLSLGLHKLTLTHGDSAAFPFEALDIITPIHSPKESFPANIQNALPVGSQSIGDSRQVNRNLSEIPNWSRAIGTFSTPSTSSSVYVPIPDMTCIIKTSGGPIEVNYSGTPTHSFASGVNYTYQVYVDGVSRGTEVRQENEADMTNFNKAISFNRLIDVGPGIHIVTINWKTSEIALSNSGTRQEMSVKEIK